MGGCEPRMRCCLSSLALCVLSTVGVVAAKHHHRSGMDMGNYTEGPGGPKAMVNKTGTARSSRRPSPFAGEGDWVFLAHHKSGTMVGLAIARTLCSARGRVTTLVIFRELPPDPQEMVPTREPMCFFMTTVYEEDLDGWLDHLWSRAGGRLVHMIRAPEEMVESGYKYHHRGSESSWTASKECSRDLCVPDDAVGAGQPRVPQNELNAAASAAYWHVWKLKKSAVTKLFAPMRLVSWLRAYGCPYNATTYFDCLRQVGQTQGIRIEARRAAATLTDMLDISARAAGDRTLELPLNQLKPERFNRTVLALAEWLGVPGTPDQLDGRVAAAAKALAESTDLKAHMTESAKLESAIETLDGRTQELAVRSSLSRVTRPPLLAAGAMKRWAPGTTGIVTCTAPKLLEATMKMVVRLRALNCTLPIEAWHVQELKAADEARLTALPGITVRDLYPSLPGAADTGLAPTLRLVRGFMCKPLALLASHFDTVILIDHDALFASDPTSLLTSEPFASTGMLFFRDRHRLAVLNAPVRNPSRYVRKLIRRRMGWEGMLKPASVEDGHDLPPLPWPWRPSEAMLSSPMARGESNHFIDSSVLLISKTAAPLVLASLYRLHDLFRFEMYANVWGDKETYWLACELVGGLRCGVSPLSAGEMGSFSSEGGLECLRGNLLQFNPTTGVPIHCNCNQVDSYTAVSKPTSNEPELLPWLSPSSNVLQVVDSANRPGSPPELRFAESPQSAVAQVLDARRCWTRPQSQPVATFFAVAGQVGSD